MAQVAGIKFNCKYVSCDYNEFNAISTVVTVTKQARQYAGSTSEQLKE